ncbi:MAG TPA: PA domain-containing protein [Pyrinomonadaceae bacterium]|nr:PA domain-containing protein [Pyrinomonadaceae bacterium]
MKRAVLSKVITAAFALTLLAAASRDAFGAATIVILNNDSANAGFNDPTPVSPVGNNAGTTLGQQRLNAFQFAANVWGATINSNVTITIRASWASLSCTSTSATLGQASSVGIFRDFPNAPVAGTWYTAALANALSGTDLDPSSPEISAQFNSNLGNTGCLDGTHFYLGLDNNHGADVDLVSVLIHEFAHGLGFISFTNASTGTQASGFPSVYDRFLTDDTTGKTWVQMTTAERQASAINTGHLVWTGPQVSSDLQGVLGTPRLRVNAPAAVAGNYTVGTADFGPHVSNGGTTGSVVQAAPNDGCSALTNASAVSGHLALLDRGTCTFVTKVKNAQNAGAIGVVVANNTSGVIEMGGGDATITIPSLMISQADGNTLKGQLNSGLNATLLLDNSALSGVDAQAHAEMFAPNPVQSGSSVSHWDTSLFPDQIMEPDISGDLIHSVAVPADLTGSELRDVGWAFNPIGDVNFFVRQHYLDFLNRQPDASGLSFWTNDIFGCGIDTACADVHRVNTSAAFFLSIEFQQTGNLVYKMYKSSFGNLPGKPVAVQRANFLADTRTIGNGVIVGQGDWPTLLENNKQTFALAFVQRPAFQSAHGSQNAATFVDSLFANAGVTPATAERNAAIGAFGAGGVAGEAAALRSVAESDSVTAKNFNEAFVLMQYFGYLQRDPDAAPDNNFNGYNFWLTKLNNFNGDFVQAEMVKAFITSDEYRHRFGP